jgi:hypothetical protein
LLVQAVVVLAEEILQVQHQQVVLVEQVLDSLIIRALVVLVEMVP